MFKVIAYGKTGFNAVNVPDNETTLNNAASYKKEFPAIDVIQRYFQPKITVRAFEDDVIDIDYIKLVDDRNPNKFAFYSVTGYTMTSGDVAELNVVMDSFLTAGGVGSFTFLDGTTTRHHTSSDDFGEFSEDDEMLIPKAVYVGHVGDCLCNDKEGTTGGTLIVSSMYDIASNVDMFVYSEMKYKSVGNAESGYVYSTYDGESEKKKNRTVINGSDRDSTDHTTFIFQNIEQGSQFKTSDWNPLKFFQYNNNSASATTQLRKNLKRFIEGGRSDIVQDAYILPNGYSTGDNTANGYLQSMIAGSVMLPLVVDHTHEGVSSVIEYTESSIHNKRVFYGKHFAFTFVSNTSGDRVTINPEMLKKDPNFGRPVIKVYYDTRPGGFPTFYFPTKYDSVDADVPASSIKGKPWASANILLTAANGLVQQTESYDLLSQINDANTGIKFTTETYGTPAKGYTSGTAQFFKNLTGLNQGDFTNAIFGGDLASAYDANRGDNQMYLDLATAAAAGNTPAATLFEREAQARQEKLQYLHATIPQVQVVSRADSGNSEQAMGNGVILYRSFVSGADLRKFDKILTQFGYKVTEPIQTSFLDNRQNFNYIEAKGVSINCDKVPKSVRDDLASMFNTGIRIWHKKPSASDYTSANPIKGGSN